MTVQGGAAVRVGPRRVLVAEDDDNLRTIVADMLARKGLEVATAENGARALAALVEGGFDAAVVDLVMPGMGGLAVLEGLRKAANGTPVVLTSGYVGLLEERRFMELGAARVFRKPYGLEDLASTVLALAGGQ